MRFFITWTFVISLTVFGFFWNASAQSNFSEADQLVTVRTVGTLPFNDNVNGVYSRSLDSHLQEVVQKNHRFEYAPVELPAGDFTLDSLKESSEIRKKAFANTKADALISGQITKNPKSIEIAMALFIAKDNSLLVQRTASIEKTDMSEVKSAVSEMYRKLISDLPYAGTVLSRQGNKVTVNIGRLDGIVEGQVVSVVQVIKLNRHPKFGFLIGSDKETIGKIKLLKVEDTLSFGRVVTEKEAGMIQVFSKLSGIDPISYPNTNSLSDEVSATDGSKKPDDLLVYGENPNAWVPTHRPTFGRIGVSFGIGTYNETVTRTTAGGGPLDASAPFYPFFSLDAEGWLTSQWSIHFALTQGMFSLDNPVSGGAPSDLSHRMSKYDFLVGYNFRLGEVLEAPRIEVLAGLTNYRMYTDTSTPAGLTTKTYKAIKTGVRGSYPIYEYLPLQVGAELFVHWQTKMSESPSISGSSDNEITQFAIFAEQDWKTNLKIRYKMDMQLYNSSYSGTATSSSSQKLTNFSAGVNYYF